MLRRRQSQRYSLLLAAVGLLAATLVAVPGIASSASVVQGTVVGWTTGNFHFDDQPEVDNTGLEAWWSTTGAANRAYLHGFAPTVMAEGPPVPETNLCHIRDASALSYGGGGDLFYEPGAYYKQRYAFFYNPDTGFYGAMKIDQVHDGGQPIDVTWYVQTNGTADFGPCDPSLYQPSFTYEISHNHAFATGWAGGLDITVSVDDGRQDIVITPGDPSNPNQWDLYDFDVAPGATITASNVPAGGGETKSLVVEDLAVTGTNAESDTITGLGPEGATVLVGPDGELEVTVGTEGTWTADFSGQLDLQLWDMGNAAIDDEDGDSTRFSYEVRPPGDLFVVRTDTDNAGVGGQNWNFDTSISVVAQDENGQEQATAVNEFLPDPEADYWWGAHLGIGVEPGWTVTATGDQSGHAVSHVVTDVVVEGWDNSCTVYGTTTYDPTYLRVDVYGVDGEPTNLVRQVDVVSFDGPVYSWQADFCDPPEPDSPETGAARINDLVNPSGQAIHWDGALGATMYHYEPGPQPRLLIELPATEWWDGSQFVNGYWLEGDAGWPLGETVDISVNGTYQGSATVVDPQSNPNEFSIILETGLDLVAGNQITASVDGGPSATLTITNLAITSVDVAGDVVHGTADPGYGPFEVGAGGNAAQDGWVADAAGNWTADLSTEFDIQGTDDVYARMDDGAGNMVDYWLWCDSCGGGGDQPWITAVLWPDTYIEGQAWNGSDVVVEVERAGNPLFAPIDLPVDTYEDGLYHDGWYFRIDAVSWGGATIEDGDVVTVTASGGGHDGVVRDLTVRPITITSVDIASATIAGTANSGDVVTVARWGDDLGNDHVEVEATHTNSTWTATLPFWPASQGEASIRELDGDATSATWGAPLLAAGIDGDEGYLDTIWGGFWYFDTSLTVEVTRDGTQEFIDTSVPGADGWWYGWNAQLTNLQVGDLVTVTGNDSGTTATHTVLDLTVDWSEADNTVFGTAGVPDGTVVRVEAQDHDHEAHRWTTVESGQWSIDYDEPIEGQEPIQIGPGVNGRVEVLADDGGRTWAPWGTHEGGGGEPLLIGEFQRDSRVYGNGFDGFGPLWLHAEGCLAEIEVGPEFEVLGVDLCDGNELQPGQRVEIVDENGDVVRDLVLHNVVITSIDLATDTISGTGDPDVPVQVIIEGDEGAPAALRIADPDGDGTWTVAFNSEPDEGAGEFGEATEIDGRFGDAKQFEEDGDFTNSSWWDLPSNLYLNLLEDFAVLSSWPTGQDIDLTVYESDAMETVVYHETIPAPGPYYLFDTQSQLGEIDLLSGHHVVAASGGLVVAHTVTELGITGFDFPGNAFYGTAYDWTTVTAAAWNDSQESEVGDLRGPEWAADFDGQVNFRLYDEIGGFVAEFDGNENATFFSFAATYEELENDDGTATTNDGRIMIENLGEDDSIQVITNPPPGSGNGFEYVGESLDIEWNGTRRTWEDPLILTLVIDGTTVPPDLNLDDIIVFKDGIEVPDCVLPLDSDDDFPCVSERLRLANDDIKLTVQTLEFSTWTMAIRSVTLDAFTSAVDPVELGTEVMATASLVDVGKASPGSLTARFTWGDGSCDAVAYTEGEAISAYHAYDEAGVYELELNLYFGTASDCAGAAELDLIDAIAFRYVVVYDPDGGFVTGGGWIDSPEGAYIPDPSLTGPATFGFVSKYQKGADEPSGNTEFNFQVADLEFHSTSYDWLVIAGAKAMFKGSGTINGMGNYGFLLSAVDAALTPSTDVDRFRIKIWDKADDDAVVYDNEVGASDDADPTTDIGGGSIVIHKAKNNAK